MFLKQSTFDSGKQVHTINSKLCYWFWHLQSLQVTHVENWTPDFHRFMNQWQQDHRHIFFLKMSSRNNLAYVNKTGPRRHGWQNWKSECQVGWNLIWSTGQEKSQRSRTALATVIALGCPPEKDAKAQLLKALYTKTAGHREINLELNQKLFQDVSFHNIAMCYERSCGEKSSAT